MRKRFEQQIKLGSLLIQDTEIPTAKRSGALPGLCAALKEIFVNPHRNEKVFEILVKAILPNNNKTGRPGMDLWQIFVLSQVGLCQNISYDDLQHIANHDNLKVRCNKAEAKKQQKSIFKKLRHKHSAIESNINELEHRGLNRCPDRGYHNYKRYIGLGVSAYNLRKIGAEIIAQTIAKQKEGATRYKS